MRLLAEPDELPAPVVDEVVRVEAVEPARNGEAHELRPGEEPHGGGLLGGHRRPVGRREVERVVDVHVADPERCEIGEVKGHRCRRAALVRLEVDGRAEVMPARLGEHEREPRVLGRSASPP